MKALHTHTPPPHPPPPTHTHLHTYSETYTHQRRMIIRPSQISFSHSAMPYTTSGLNFIMESEGFYCTYHVLVLSSKLLLTSFECVCWDDEEERRGIFTICTSQHFLLIKSVLCVYFWCACDRVAPYWSEIFIFPLLITTTTTTTTTAFISVGLTHRSSNPWDGNGHNTCPFGSFWSGFTFCCLIHYQE